MLVQSFKVSDNDPTKNSFVNYNMSLVKIQGFNALVDNKPFFDQPIKKQIRSIWKTCRNVKKR